MARSGSKLGLLLALILLGTSQAARRLEQTNGGPQIALDHPSAVATASSSSTSTPSATEAAALTPPGLTIREGNRDELAATVGLLTGPGKAKFSMPAKGGRIVQDGFIVAVSEDTTPEELQELMSLGAGKSATVRDISGPAFKGLAIEAPPGQLKQADLLQALIESGKVTLVAPNMIATLVATQNSPPWGLDRIDDRTSPKLDSTYVYTGTGADVTAYILDTGVRTDHVEFGARASMGADFTTGGAYHWHGTHVAGTIGGTTWGVAKEVKLVGVRVLDSGGSGTGDWLLSGINWVTEACKLTKSKKCVVNMSLGFGSVVSWIDSAITNSINNGVVYAVAAGNSNKDACRSTPGSVRAALVVGASDSGDVRAYFSNYGACVDLFAPGVDVVSAYSIDTTSAAYASGTSMATPHVAGVAALYLSNLTTPITTSTVGATVQTALINAATTAVVVNAGPKSPNRLLYTSY